MSTLTESETEAQKEYLRILKKQLAALRLAMESAVETVVIPAKIPVLLIDSYDLFIRKITQTAKRHHLRYLVTSPDVKTIFMHSLLYRPVQDESDSPVKQTGYLGDLIVFVDPYFPTDKILVARGSLDDPEEFIIVNPVLIKVTNLMD
jgi:hypothetical protein